MSILTDFVFEFFIDIFVLLLGKQGSQLQFRPVVIGETQTINKLVMRSKSHWPYPADYLEKCARTLWIDEIYISNWPVYMGELNGKQVGVFALKTVDGENRLDHLWIDPPYIRKGYGKILFGRAVEEAKRLGWRSFRLAADPYALEFYLKLGGRQIGTVQSRIKPDLVLPHVEFSF